MFEYAEKLKSSNNSDRREMGEKIQIMIDANEWISRAKPVFKINDRMDIIMQMRKPSQTSIRASLFKARLKG
jgi:hypothetical protein